MTTSVGNTFLQPNTSDNCRRHVVSMKCYTALTTVVTFGTSLGNNGCSVSAADCSYEYFPGECCHIWLTHTT